MALVFSSLISGSLLDPIGGNNLTLTAGSTGFVQTDKGLALSNESHWASLDSALTFQPGMSLSFNVMFRTINTYNSLFGSNHAFDGYLRLRNGDPTNGFDYENDNGDNVNFNHNEGLTPNIWYNFTFIWSSDNTLDFYLNAGSKHSSGTITGELSIERIMAGYDGPDLVGYMNNFSAYDTEITTKERNELYANFLASSQIGQPKRGFTVQKPTDLSRHTDDGLVAAYNMTLDEDGKVTDLTGNGFDLTNDGCLPSSDGLVFDGVDDELTGGAVGSVKTIVGRIRIKSFAGTRYFIDMGSNTLVGYNGGATFISNNLTGVTKYLDGLVNSSFSLNMWQTFVITFDEWATSKLDIGEFSSDYSDIELADLKLYSRAWTAQEAIDYHNSFILPTLVETFDEGASGVAKLPQDWISGTGTYKISQVNQSDTLPAFPDGIKLYDKYLECTVAGTIATLSGQAFGTWEWDMLKGADGNASIIQFIADSNNAFPNYNGYQLYIWSTEGLYFDKITGAVSSALFRSASSSLNINQWYHVKVTRTKAGVFNVWIDGVLVVVTSGSNPVTDTTYSTSVFTVLDLDAGDRVANFFYTDEIRQ